MSCNYSTSHKYFLYLWPSLSPLTLIYYVSWIHFKCLVLVVHSWLYSAFIFGRIILSYASTVVIHFPCRMDTHLHRLHISLCPLRYFRCCYCEPYCWLHLLQDFVCSHTVTKYKHFYFFFLVLLSLILNTVAWSHCKRCAREKSMCWNENEICTAILSYCHWHNAFPSHLP